MKLNKLLNAKGDALRRELLKTETSREDKQKSFKTINNNSNEAGSNNNELFYYKVTEKLNNQALLSLSMFTPIVAIGTISGDMILPCTFIAYTNLPFSDDGRYLKYIVTSSDIVFISDDMNVINGQNMFLKGSIEDRLKLFDTTMESTFPNIIRITKEEYENSITDKFPE